MNSKFKKIIVIPDSFKGTMSSAENCEICQREIKAIWPECEVITVPVADGGEGSVDCFLTALGGEKMTVKVTGPLGKPLMAYYGILPDKKTAVIEMAASAGLPLVGEHANPLITTTYGVGELMLDAVTHGCRKIIMGLGGSSTNDAGCGMAAALGYRFINYNGVEFIPVGGTLCEVAQIRNNADTMKDIEIITMCDIDNPLFGRSGAAYVFAPQKGADSLAVDTLDQGLIHISQIIKRDLGIDVSALPGGGAAGGMGAGMAAFLGSPLKMGIDAVLDTVKFDDLLNNTDLVLTGEGKLDSQSLRGKAVIGIARRAKAAGVPVIAIVGGYDASLDDAYSEGVSAVFAINRLPEPLAVSGPKTLENFTLTVRNVLKSLSIFSC